MGEHDTLELLKYIVGALFVVVNMLVGVLVYFLKRLQDKTIPEMGLTFERTNAALIAEMKAQRDQCREDHDEQRREADQRHREVMAVLQRPFGVGREYGP